MSAPTKGYPSDQKSSALKYGTLEPVREHQHGGSVVAHSFTQIIGADAAEAASTTDTIVATAHAALVGDVISFTSGALTTKEAKVYSVAANAIVLAEQMSSAPGVGDTFNILRHKYPVVGASGASTVQVTDGVDTLQLYVEDTPAAGGETGLVPLAMRNSAGAVTTNADGDYAMFTVDDTGRLRVDATVTEAAVFPEDTAHVSGDNIKSVGGVRNDASIVLTSTDGDYSPFAVDSAGRTKVVAESVIPGVAATSLGKAEDAAHTTGDTGVMSLAVRNDAGTALAGTTGDYIPLTTDANGNLWTNLATALPAGNNNIGDVDVASVVPGVAATNLGKAEDAVHASGDTGVMSLAVRNNAGTALAADGDYIPLMTDTNGYLWATIGAALPAGNNNIGDMDVASVIPGTGATNLGKAEDSVHASGDVGVMALAVRQDATAALAADGDYTPLQTDANGFLKVASSESAVFAEDAAHASGDLGKFILAVRNDAAATLTSTDGDYSPLAVDLAGRAKVVIDTIVPGVAATSLGKAEDAAHTTGDTGVMALAVRNDAGTALAGTTGDYIPLTTDVNGAMWTHPTPASGRSKVNLIRNDYTGTAVTAAAYVQLVAATAAAINKLSVFDSSGQTLVFAVGAAASEVDQFYIFPGGNGDVELSIPTGARLSVKAVSATANVGELTINTFS